MTRGCQKLQMVRLIAIDSGDISSIIAQRDTAGDVILIVEWSTISYYEPFTTSSFTALKLKS